MRRIKDSDVELEKLRMSYEKLKMGRILLVGTGESEDFWREERYNVGNRWWKLWRNKTDFEIIRDR
jgi:hypothetical protein